MLHYHDGGKTRTVVANTWELVLAPGIYNL